VVHLVDLIIHSIKIKSIVTDVGIGLLMQFLQGRYVTFRVLVVGVGHWEYKKEIFRLLGLQRNGLWVRGTTMIYT
jgi:hypothetical protein